MKKTINNRRVKTKLTHTWETYDDIESQYMSSDSDLSEDSILIINYINNLDEFSRKVFYLYSEYGSYRAVADETNRAKDTIAKIINEIREDIINNKHITEEEK